MCIIGMYFLHALLVLKPNITKSSQKTNELAKINKKNKSKLNKVLLVALLIAKFLSIFILLFLAPLRFL